jgi:aryl-alcohol dehydrogenase-like predicted oxidoreductase
MKQIRLGKTGPAVSAVGLGCMGMSDLYGPADADESAATIRAALDAGVTLFDTGDFYGMGHNEMLIASTLRDVPRDRYLLSVKFGALRSPDGQFLGFDLRPNAIKSALAYSLKRLGTDYIDLFQLHGFDAKTPIEETLSTLDDLVRAGKIRYLGVSNFSGWHLMKSLATADRYGWTRYVANQTYYSLIGRDYEWELMPLGQDQGVGAVVWSPLGWGRLTGKIRRNQPLPAESRLHDSAEFGPPIDDEQLYRVIDAMDEIAKETGKTIPQIALNWLLQRPTVSSVIIGARNEEQLAQNLGAIGWNLDAAQIARLDAASMRTTGYPYYPYWHQQGFAERNPPPV